MGLLVTGFSAAVGLGGIDVIHFLVGAGPARSGMELRISRRVCAGFGLPPARGKNPRSADCYSPTVGMRCSGYLLSQLGVAMRR